MITPLTRRDKSDTALRRPPNIEAQITEALDWDIEQVLNRASLPEKSEGSMSSETLVHLIRADLKRQGTPMAELLIPILLARCAANLNYTVRGFREPTLSNVREEILGCLALLLVDPSNKADFFEVRFSLALVRLRIDCCHKHKRSDDHLIFLDNDSDTDLDGSPPQTSETQSGMNKKPLDAEQSYALKQALSRLNPQERQVLLLHRLGGIPINAGEHCLVNIMGCSERTIRNRLRSAEQTLAAIKEHGL